MELDTVKPQAIVYCESPRDVSTAIKFARDNHIAVHTRSGGHSLAGWSTGQGMVLDVSRLNRVSVGQDTVRLGPGVQTIDALTTLQPYNRQIVGGTCATVRMGGYISGGGIGFQVRKFGVASDRLVSAQVVLSDGRIVRASETRHPDLFWALRGGGGGNFGVATDFEVRPIAATRMVYFDTLWPWDKAQEVITAWQEWCSNGSNNLGSTLNVLLRNGAPGNVPMIKINGGYLGPQAEIEQALNELAAASGATPSFRAVKELPYDEAMKAVYGCEQLAVQECHRAGTNPDAKIQRTPFLRERTRLLDRPTGSAGVADLLAAFEANRRPGHITYLYMTALGGAANKVSRTQTAYVHRGAEFFVACATLMANAQPSAEEAEAAMLWPIQAFNVIDPLSSGESYLNFPNPDLDDWRQAYYGENYRRLVSVKRRYDAPNFFRHPQSIGS
ncbi:FAD-dependent oxidoreductase (plasmid) [Streptomyces xanthophaeus]|uniref:FAD-dependent oxidoreductase n=1 Tax=Streptomyces xanthophaeus TaxID=67385 RepID=UPI00386E94F7|nr:FAD-dependent oxidoreductase [Streptomyces xanthophaeus]WST65956.1 FAD-dependent oxidoreductase [Streptomyces xanthophaeus]